MSAARIAKRAGVEEEHVDTALTVAPSRVATAVTAKYDLTLDRAAVIAECDDDPDAVRALTVTAAKDPGRFDHPAHQDRDARTEQAEHAALVAELTGQGTTVMDAPAEDDHRFDRLHGPAALGRRRRIPRMNQVGPRAVDWTRGRP